MPGLVQEEWQDPSYRLTPAQKQHWLDHGFVKISDCFTKEFAETWTASIWTRLGADANDKTTWPTEKMNLPGHTVVPIKEYAPKAYAVMCELAGGEEKVADWCKNWKDGWIPNFGSPDMDPNDEIDFRHLDNWHCDGDWFTHYLDSPEQALLVIPLFSDIKPKGGGTAICTDGIKLVAEKLHSLPQGAMPNLAPRDGGPEIPKTDPRRRARWNGWIQDPSLCSDDSFHEATGEVGDVYFLHPFMLHSASKNLRRDVRIITNPPVALKEPFDYNRPDGQYSLIEQKTLRDLGKPEGLPDWKITGPRERLTSAGGRVKMQAEMKQKEIERLRAANVPIHKLATVTDFGLDDYPS